MQQASAEAMRKSNHAATHQQRDWAPGQWVYVFRRAKQNQDLHLRIAGGSALFFGGFEQQWHCLCRHENQALALLEPVPAEAAVAGGSAAGSATHCLRDSVEDLGCSPVAAPGLL